MNFQFGDTVEWSPKLRLEVMMSIQHPEEYYQQAAKSAGMNPDTMTHEEISIWAASIKLVEADIMIEVAAKTPHYKIADESI